MLSVCVYLQSGKYKIALFAMFAVGLITIVAGMGMAMGATQTSRPLAELVVTPQVIRDCVPNYADVSN